MLSVTVRIPNETRNTLKALAHQEGESMQSVLEKAIEFYRRQRFLEEINIAYARFKEDPTQQKEWEKEFKTWDSTLADGLGLPEEKKDKQTSIGTKRRKK